jgi:hypothetical protein
MSRLLRKYRLHEETGVVFVTPRGRNAVEAPIPTTRHPIYGPFPAGVWEGGYLKDSQSNDVFALVNHDTTHDFIRAVRLDGSGQLVLERNTGRIWDYLFQVTQDAENLYCIWNEPGFVKLRKSDLSEVYISARPAGEGATAKHDRIFFANGKLWTLNDTTANPRLYSWNTSTGAVVDTVNLSSGGVRLFAYGYAADGAGNIYLAGQRSNDVSSPPSVALAKVDTSLTFSYLATSALTFSSDPADVGMCYYAADNSLIAASFIPAFADPKLSALAKFDIGSGAWVQYLDPGRSLGAAGNNTGIYGLGEMGVARYRGNDALFIGQYNPNISDPPYSIVEVDPASLTVRQVLSLPADDWMEPQNVIIIPTDPPYLLFGAWDQATGNSGFILRMGLA